MFVLLSEFYTSSFSYFIVLARTFRWGELVDFFVFLPNLSVNTSGVLWKQRILKALQILAIYRDCKITIGVYFANGVIINLSYVKQHMPSLTNFKLEVVHQYLASLTHYINT